MMLDILEEALFLLLVAVGCVPLERWWDRAALDAHIALLRSGAPAPHCALRVGPSATEVYEVSRCRWRPGRPQEPTGSRA